MITAKIPLTENGLDNGTFIEIVSGSRGCTIRNVTDHIGGPYVSIPSPEALDAIIARLPAIREDIQKNMEKDARTKK